MALRATEQQQKANSTSQSSERTINDSNRVFGLDGTSDNYGKFALHPPMRQRHFAAWAYKMRRKIWKAGL